MKNTNTINPLAAANPSKLAALIVGLMPKSAPMSPEETAKFEKERSEGEARYREARFGLLPPDTYRILDQGGIIGWHYELEIDGKTVVLQEPGQDFSSAYAVHANKPRTEELARAEVERMHGEDAAKRAIFSVVWGGSL